MQTKRNVNLFAWVLPLLLIGAVTLSAADVVNEATLRFPLQGLEFNAYKMMDPATGELFESVTDDNGTEVDVAEYRAREQALHREKYGKLVPALYEMLKTTPPGDRLRVHRFRHDGLRSHGHSGLRIHAGGGPRGRAPFRLHGVYFGAGGGY